MITRVPGFRLCVGLGAITLALIGAAEAERCDAATRAEIVPSGEEIELIIQSETGTSKDIIPLYRAEGIRYFSAGVGIEERQAEYPPFPLKLVFTAGGKPYLSGVKVTITDEKGSRRVTIPQEQVAGPWLFLDLPPGTYHIAATKDDVTQGLKGVKVQEGRVKVVHLRWPEPRNQ